MLSLSEFFFVIEFVFHLKTLKSQAAETEDVFYEHDHYKTKEQICEKHSESAAESSENPVFYVENTFKSANVISDHSVYRPASFLYTKLKSFSCSILIIVSILFIFFFFLMLIEHWKCTSSASIINKSRNMPNCNYQKTLQKLSNNLQFGMQHVMNVMFNQKNSILSWPIDAENSIFRFDPFFSWFSSNHIQEN